MNIKELRAKHNLSQQDLADKTGIPRPRIAKWEEGKGNPKTEDQQKLDKLFAKLGEVPDRGTVAAIITATGHDEQIAQEPQPAKSSLERTLENLSEDKLRSTAIIERLVSLLELQLNAPGPHNSTRSESGEDLRHKKTSTNAG